MIPKIMQIAEEAPHIYEAADRIVEAADWIVYQLCGSLKRSNCTATKQSGMRRRGIRRIIFRKAQPVNENDYKG